MQKYRTWLIAFSSILSFLYMHTQPFMGSEINQQLPILVVGGAMCDFFLHLDNSHQEIHTTPGYIHFEEGKKISLQSLACHTGGGGLNAALALHKLGVPVKLFAQIGNDTSGAYIIQELEKIQLGTDLIQRDTQHYTGTSFILPSQNGNNTILMSRGANRYIDPLGNPLIRTQCAFSGVYLAPLSGESIYTALKIAQSAKTQNLPLLCNPSNHQIENIDYFLDLIKNVTILLINETEAAALAKNLELPLQDLQDEIALAQYLRDHGPTTCIITNGSKGTLFSTQGQTIFQDACQIIPKKSVGAGDTFGATYFGTLLLGFSTTQSLLFGSLNSASVLTKETPHDGLLSLEFIMQQTTNNPSLPACHEIN